jgi:FlaA1/EpsC-like NDP-sugar epimerase
LHEQLVNESEATLPTRYQKIRLVESEPLPPIEDGLARLWTALEARDEKKLLRILQELVPEYMPQTPLLASVRDHVSGEFRVQQRRSNP